MTSASSSEVAAGMHVSSSTSELRQIEELVWELPANRRHARSRAGLRRPRIAGRHRRRGLTGAARQRRDAARRLRSRPGDARHPPGLRLPRRRRGGHGAARRRRLPRRSRLRHQLRRPPARSPARARASSATGGRRSSTSSPAPSRRARARRAGSCYDGGRARSRAARGIACARRARVGDADDLESPSPAAACPGPIRVRSRDVPRSGSRPDRHAGLGQPLPRGAGGRRDPRRGRRTRVRPARTGR